MNIKRYCTTALAVMFILAGAGSLYALRPPHDTASNNVTCGSCHKPGGKIRGFKPVCIESCHNTTANNASKRKPLELQFASNVFGTFTNQATRKQFSHAWATLPNYSALGKNNKRAGANKYITINQTNVKGVTGTNTIICSKCHYAHGATDYMIAQGTMNKPFIRASTKGDFICLQCHEERRVGAGSARSAPVAGKAYSHPVEVNYSTIRAGKPEFYETSPTNSYGLPSAKLPLYTTYGNVKGAVICSTCHGPLHSADSNPYTLDNLSSFSFGKYSGREDGYLLRRYSLKSGKSDAICTACHKVKTHQGNKCGDCHEPHKKAGDNNLYLIKKVIATPYGNHSVFFTSTTQMAKRYGIYSGSVGNFTQRSTAICQVCHRTKSHHRAYSTTGADRVHNVTRNCTACHPHNATGDGFRLEGGCAGCHGQPPDEAFGKHGKHTNDAASHSWKDGKNSDARSAASYGFSCGRCHNPWTPYTATVENYKGPRHFTDFGSYKTYTADIGFANGTPLPANDTTKAGYNFGARGSVDNGPSPTDNFGFNTPLSGAGTCRNIFCHGQFYNGYTSNDPIWNANNNQPCGKCHGVAPELGKGIPGNTGGSNWGAHPRHAGNAAQQYGTGGRFRCNACHAISATQNAISSVGLDRRYHVNGRINLQFYSSFGYSESKYGTYNNYSAAIPTTITKPAYKTCQRVYCHSDGSRMSNFSTQSHTNSMPYPNWSSIKNFTTTVGGIKTRCVRCHGNSTYKGITAAMPGVTSKGNSHEKHIRNGFLCYDCHSVTVTNTNRAIASTTQHVDKDYDVDIITRYGGSYDKVTKRCSNVKCHGGRTTQPWGYSDTNNCKDCHYKSTAETTADKGYRDNYAWKSMTSTSSVPKIYSSEWMKYGHGATAAYPNSGNSGASKVCTTCHKQSGTVSHSSEMTNNPFRVYTAAGHIDDLCQQCHASSKPNTAGGGADRKVLTHYTTGWNGWGTPRASWPFMPKCIDCHDPHGDNNNRYMIKAYINYSGSLTTAGNVGKRSYDQNPTVLMAFSTAGGNQINWSSYVKSSFQGICQRCHGTQTNMAHFRKYSAVSGDGYDAGHNPKNRCTGCHKHDTGFKGADCGGCHYFPPTLSGRHTQHTVSTVTKGYPSYDFNNTATRVAYGCGKCHDQASSQHIENATPGLYTTEVVFDGSHTVPKNPGANYAFGAKSSFDQGADGAGGYTWVSTKGTCRNTFCHGQFFGGYTGNDPNWYNNGPDDPQTCGKCHGAVKNTSGYPTGGAHVKHLDTTKYNMPCKTCHREVTGAFNSYTVTNRQLHVNGVTNIRLYTTSSDATVGSRIGRYARYGNSANDFANVTTNTSVGAAPAYRYCLNTYCHSRGTSTLNPYTSKIAYPNYTAQWGKAATQTTGAGKECSLCHGNKTYSGITAAMPFQTGQAHKVHVIDNNFTKCYICHANVVDSNNNIVSTTNHVNKFKNISVIKTYKTANESYSGQKCSNIKCHGGRLTPAWSAAATCKDCHYSTATPEDDFKWGNYTSPTGVTAKIYSSEWAKRGHGRSGSNYPFSGNAPANKGCDKCHTTQVKHNDANYFRLLTAVGTDSNALCMRCHGSGTQLKSGYGNRTGITNHTYADMSTTGDWAGGTNGKAPWNNPAPKCVDCHDPHGDKNNQMIHSYINMTGSDGAGRPLSPYPQDTILMNFTAQKGTYIGYSDFVNSSNRGICQRCHSAASATMGFYAKDKNDTTHMTPGAGKCTNCHSHKKGFTPSGCDSCHGEPGISYAPPKGPSGWSDSLTNKSSVHNPHSKNPRNRPGFSNYTGKNNCDVCHDDGNGQASGHGSNSYAGMKNLTSQATPLNRRSKLDYGTGTKNPANDTCWNTGCHTPRAYTRTWKKPTKCDDCHGTIRLRGATERAYKLHTTMSHKIHINYTGVANPPAAWGKNYRFACTNCHYNVGNNYSTHYSGQVNITSNGPVNTVGGQFYTRGRSFKGFTTGNEVTTTTYCTKTYCHGNFQNGTTTTRPSWKKGATTLYCIGCHKAKTARVTAWTNGTTMPERHPKHVRTSTYNFACSKCHWKTVSNNTTVYFQYSSHVNGRKDTVFDNTSGTFNAQRQCMDNYCHSSGQQTVPRGQSNYTADWDHVSASSRTNGKPCSYCHGNRTWNGITAAMPDQSGQAHAKHAHNTSGDNFKCYVCHANVVNSAGDIISYTNHVNKFKNISIILTYKSGATNYTAGTKKCDNVKCHNSRQTPVWTGTANCQDCHYSTVKDTDNNANFRNYTGAVAAIYSSQWADRGHGRTIGTYPVSGKAAANKVCTDCHSSAVKHGVSTNPFRLTNSNTTTLCTGCHSSGIFNHNSSVTDGRYGFDVKCVDCHDPHGDNNIFMLHSTVALPAAGNSYTPSDQYGKSKSGVTFFNVDFTNNAGGSDYASTADANNISRVCNVCHSRTTNPPTNNQDRFRRDQLGGQVNDTHNSTSKCTSCHGHNKGFEGAGASSGGQACGTCHSALFNSMTSANAGYHHVMKNADRVYSDSVAPTVNDAQKRCLMCHTDHNIFNSKKAKNLRSQVAANYSTGINTDFWPAKRPETQPISGPAGNGVCISCHSSDQTKNTTNRKDNGTTKARGFSKFMYYSSSHNFQIISGMQDFDDDSSFRANCVKCHTTGDINKPGAQTGRYKLGLHNQNTQSLLDNSTSSSKPKIEEFCYKCHGKKTRATYDYYSSVSMNSGSKMIETAIIAKKTGHPIDSDAMAGRHKADEFFNVPNSYKAGRSAGEGTGSGWNRGSNRHVECTDCHNTHGGNASIVRTLGTNGISGAQAGTWGVKVTYSGTGATQPTYSTIRQVTKQYEVCLKCHSAFAYYTMPPVTPSGNIARSTTFGEWDPNSPQSDVGIDFHPNAHGFHPVVTKGRNQPPKSANASWPLTKSDWKYRDPVTDTDKFMAVSGLSWTFVPPYSQHSTLVCSDCHRADNTGNAIGRVKYKTGTSPTLVNSWTNVGTAAQAEATLYRVDDVLSTTTQASSSIQITVDYPGNAPASEPSEVWIVGYACGSDTGKTTRDFTLSATIEGTTSIGSGTYRFPLCSAGVGRGEKKATTTEVWAGLTNGTHTVKLATTATAQTVSVDYIGIEAIYKETADVRGPHGSLDRWLLVDLDRKVRFDANRDGDLLDPGDVPNSTTKTGAYATEDDFRKTFCFNCHRIDVYNGTSDNFDGVPDATNPNGEYSRVTHPVEGAVASSSLNPWGIWCLNCHGGRVYEVVGTGAGVKPWMTKRQNEIHGSFANMTVYHTTNGAVRVKINRPKGVRLLHGALLVGVNAPPSYTASGAKWTGDITCYTTDVNDSMSSCNSHAGTSGTKNMTFNYSYSSW